MSESVFKIVQPGLFKEISGPAFGKQHQGVAPGGAMDLFSFEVGNILLNKAIDIHSLEIIIAPVLEITSDCWIVLTGAKYDQVTITNKDATLTAVPFATVCFAENGSRISFGNKTSGFRSYLSILPCRDKTNDLSDRCRPDYHEIYNWVDDNGKIRVVEGPEFSYLIDPTAFTNTYWTITSDFSDMGFRLSTRDNLPEVTLKSMISEAVADGTVQLTPKGPIVLLKHRQTVGGYPRIFNVVSADVDILGQYAPNQILRFTKVTIDQALAIANQKKSALSKVITLP